MADFGRASAFYRYTDVDDYVAVAPFEYSCQSIKMQFRWPRLAITLLDSTSGFLTGYLN
jgi:hypothetical protein